MGRQQGRQSHILPGQPWRAASATSPRPLLDGVRGDSTGRDEIPLKGKPSSKLHDSIQLRRVVAYLPPEVAPSSSVEIGLRRRSRHTQDIGANQRGAKDIKSLVPRI